jgi:hypothetical protein
MKTIKILPLDGQALNQIAGCSGILFLFFTPGSVALGNKRSA